MRLPSGTIHYDNLPEPSGGGFNDLAYSKGHRRWAFIPEVVGDPNETGTIDDAAVITAIGNIQWLDQIEYGILDFENPYIEHLAEGVADVSATNYQSALAEMVDLIEKVRVEYPQIQWCFYRIPTVRFFIANNTWHGLEQAGDLATIEERLNSYHAAYGPLIDAQDFISPEILERYVAPDRDEQTKRFHHYAIETCRRYNADRGTSKHIVANIAATYQYSNEFEEYLPVFIDPVEMFEETIDPVIGHGARSFLIWTGFTFWVPSVFNLATYPLDHVGHPESLRVHRVNRYRAAFTEEFFNGVAPDWSSADDEETLRRGLCEKMIDTMDYLQNRVRTKGAARRSTLEALGGLEPGPIG